MKQTERQRTVPCLHKSSIEFVECTEESSTSMNIIFTGHRAQCAYENGTHVSQTNVLGRAEGIGVGNRCAIFLHEFGDITNYDSLKMTLVHEILHVLGVTHHYSSGEVQCVHGREHQDEDTIAEITICNQCVDVVNCNKLYMLYGHNP